MVVRLPDRESRSIRRAYCQFWLRPYGRSERIISDQEKGVLRGAFAGRASAKGIELDPMGAENEYQDDRTETAGQLGKRTYHRTPPSRDRP